MSTSGAEEEDKNLMVQSPKTEDQLPPPSVDVKVPPDNQEKDQKIISQILDLIQSLEPSSKSILKKKLGGNSPVDKTEKPQTSKDGAASLGKKSNTPSKIKKSTASSSKESGAVYQPMPAFLHPDAPRLPIFSGSKASKGEVTFHQWRYEAMCLAEDPTWPEPLIMQAIRRSLRGLAGELLLNLGMKVTVLEVIAELDSTFGNVSTSEQLMENFFSARQRKEET
jgi:hypothetical protein